MRFPSSSTEFFKQLEAKNRDLKGIDRTFVKHPLLIIGGILAILALEFYYLLWVIGV